MSSFFSAKPLRSFVHSPQGNMQLYPQVGAESSSSPYDVQELQLGQAVIAIYSLKTTGFPVWAFAGSTNPGNFNIWLYLGRVGIPIFAADATPPRWTNVSKFVSQTANAADADTISSADVSKGGVIRSGDSLFASDALGISEVELKFDTDAFPVPLVKVKAAKGLVKTEFNPITIYLSIQKPFDALAPQETKPPVGAPPIPQPPTSLPKTPASAKPFPTGKWVTGGLVMGTLLYALGRRP